MTGYLHSRGALARRPARSLAASSGRLAALAIAAALTLLPAPAAPEPETGVVGDTSELTQSVKLPPPGQTEVLPASPHPFRAGEALKFEVQYGPIHAGQAYLEVPEVRDYQGHSVFHLLARAESNSFFS